MSESQLGRGYGSKTESKKASFTDLPIVKPIASAVEKVSYIFTNPYIGPLFTTPVAWAGIKEALINYTSLPLSTPAQILGGIASLAGVTYLTEKFNQRKNEKLLRRNKAPYQAIKRNEEQHKLVSRRTFVKGLIYGATVVGSELTGTDALVPPPLGTLDIGSERVDSKHKVISEKIPDVEKKVVLRHAYANPDNVLSMVSSGKADIEGKDYDVPLDVLGAFSQRQPVEFIDGDGNTVATYYKVLSNPQKFPPNAFIKRLVKGVEGDLYYNDKSRFKSRAFTAKLLKRKVVDGVSSGGSDPASQLVGLITGKPGHPSSLNPQHPNILHDKNAYSAEDVGNIAQAWEAGVATSRLDNLFAGEPLVNDTVLARWIPTPKQQLGVSMERIIVGERITSIYGEDEVLSAYLNYVPFENFQGVGGLALYLYGVEDVNQLTNAQQLIMVRMIQNADADLNDLRSIRDNGGSFNTSKIVENCSLEAETLFAKGVITQAERDSILNGLQDINFTLNVPSKYRNEFLDIEVGVGSAVRQRMEAVIGEPDKGLNLNSNAEIYTNKVVVSLELPELGVENTFKSKERKVFVEPSTEPNSITKFIENNSIEAWDREGNRFYVLTLPDGREINIPEFMGMKGLGVSIVNTSPNGEVTVIEDGVTGLPFMAGSTIKPFIYSFLLSKGFISDMYSESSTDDVPREGLPVALDGSDFLVKDSTHSFSEELGRELTLAEFVGASKNIKVQELLKGYLETNQNGWKELQDFMKDLGIEFVDIYGNSAESPTALAAIGSDIFIGSVNPTESPLTAYSKAYAVFADPDNSENIRNKPHVINAIKQVSQVLADDRTREPFWREEVKDMMSSSDVEFPEGTFGYKTGTVAEGNIIRDVLTAGFYFDNEGNKVTIVTHLIGADAAGNITDLKKVNSGESFTSALPIAEYLLKNSIKNPEVKSEEDKARGDLNALFNEHSPDLNEGITLRVSGGLGATEVFDEAGNTIAIFPARSVVDCIGEPNEENLQKVVINTEAGLKVGYINSVNMEEYDMATFLQYNTIDIASVEAKNQLIAELFGQEYLIPSSKQRVIIVDKNSTSPILSGIANIMEKNEDLVSGPELLGTLMQRVGIDVNAIFIKKEFFDSLNPSQVLRRNNPDLLNNLMGIQGKFNDLQQKLGEDNKLDRLFRNPDGSVTPSFILLESIINPRSASSNIRNALLPYSKGSSREGLLRLYRIAHLYSDLSNEDLKLEFLELIQGLNENPNSLELKALGLA